MDWVQHTDFNLNLNFNLFKFGTITKKIYWDWPAVSELEAILGRPQQAQAGNAKQNLRLNSDVNTETKKWGCASWTANREKLARQKPILPIQFTRRQ